MLLLFQIRMQLCIATATSLSWYGYFYTDAPPFLHTNTDATYIISIRILVFRCGFDTDIMAGFVRETTETLWCIREGMISFLD